MKRYSKRPRSFSNEVSSNNAKSHFPGHLSESSGLGIYQSILNRAVLQICKIAYVSMIEGSFTDFTGLYTVLKLEQMVSGFLEQ